MEKPFEPPREKEEEAGAVEEEVNEKPFVAGVVVEGFVPDKENPPAPPPPVVAPAEVRESEEDVGVAPKLSVLFVASLVVVRARLPLVA
jgi:hypothetical protein